MDTSVSRDMVN